MAPPEKSLLAIIELGGYPDFGPIYRQAGFEATTTNTMRKALTLSKKLRPDVVVAEFHFGPTYGSRISNLETLFAGLQRDNPAAKLIVFVDKENQQHLSRISDTFPLYEVMVFPIDRQRLAEAVERAARELMVTEG